MVVLLILERFRAKRVVTAHLAALSFMALDLRKSHNCWTVRALDPEGVDDFLDHTRSSTNFDVKMAHGAIFVHNEPVLDAELAVKLVAIIALFRIATHLEADLAK